MVSACTTVNLVCASGKQAQVGAHRFKRAGKPLLHPVGRVPEMSWWSRDSASKLLQGAPASQQQAWPRGLLLQQGPLPGNSGALCSAAHAASA